MSEACPFRQWAPKLKSEPARNFWIECARAAWQAAPGGAGTSDLRLVAQLPEALPLKETKAWRPEGTTEDYLSIGPESRLYEPVRRWLWRRVRRYVKRRDGGRCTECGIEVKGRRVPYEIHHIVPRSRGGTEHPANLRTLCSKCHMKYTKELREENVVRQRRDRAISGRATKEHSPGKGS